MFAFPPQSCVRIISVSRQRGWQHTGGIRREKKGIFGFLVHIGHHSQMILEDKIDFFVLCLPAAHALGPFLL